MMKKTVLLMSVCCAMAWTACSDNKDYYDEEVANKAAGIVTPDLNNMASLTTYQVTANDIVPGMVTVVKCNGQIIAATQEPVIVDVPKTSRASTRSSGITTELMTLDALQQYFGDNEVPSLPYWKLWQVICFGDTKALDFDYNDMVLHAKMSRSGNQLTIGVQCVAMGNTKKLSLGIDLMKKNEKNEYESIDKRIVIEDCKATFFPNAQPTEFVYTVPDEASQCKDRTKHCVKNFRTIYTHELTGNNLDYVVNYYIETSDGQTIYAIPSKTGEYPSMIAVSSISDKGWPLAFTISDTGLEFTFDRSQCQAVEKENVTTGTCGLDWFDYPAEQQNICSVYPLFRDWVEGKGDGNFMRYNQFDKLEYKVCYNAEMTDQDASITNHSAQYMFCVPDFKAIDKSYPAIENGLYALTNQQGQ